MRLQPQPGWQERYASSRADIAIGGATAGCGRTWAELFEVARWAHLPRFNAVVFARRQPQLRWRQGIWEATCKLYPQLGASRDERHLSWQWPSGATLELASLRQVEDAQHYADRAYDLVQFSNLVEFEPEQFWAMLGTLRGSSGVAPYVRATTLPNPDSWVRELIDWWLDPAGFAIPERIGKLRWFVRVGGELQWADAPEPLAEAHPGAKPRSLTYVPGSPRENAALLEQDPLYLEQLEALEEPARLRLLEGNWHARPGGQLLPDPDRSPVSLAEFIKAGWHVIEPGTTLAWNWHLDLICAHLEAATRGELTRLLINIPPGHMKSLIVAVFWPAWVWLQLPSWRVIFASYDLELSTRDSVRCRDLIASDWYRETYNPSWRLKKDQNVKRYFQNTAGGARQALSVTGKGTGFRGDAVIFDDPHNVKERPTDEELAGVQFWWDKRMSSRLNDMRTGLRAGIMQRVHENDLSGHIAKKRNQYVQVRLPTEFDPARACNTQWGKDPRTEAGELLFPEMFPLEVVDEIKDDLGPYDYEGQHQQNPSPIGGGVIKAEWFRFWYPPDEPRPKRFGTRLPDGTMHLHEQVELPEKFNAQLQSWDMTFKKRSRKPGGKHKPDYVVGQVWGLLRRRRYLLDQVRARMSFTETVEAVRQLSELWPKAERKLVEDAANGPAIMDELEIEVGGFDPITASQSKEARAHSASHTIRVGYIYLPHPELYPWVRELLHEVTVFPNGANDDQLDALTQLVNETRAQPITALERMTKL